MGGEEEYGRLRWAPNHALHILREGKIYAAAFSSSLPQRPPKARAIMETLPLAKEQLMDHEYIPVGPLMPLRALMGPGAQQ